MMYRRTLQRLAVFFATVTNNGNRNDRQQAQQFEPQLKAIGDFRQQNKNKQTLEWKILRSHYGVLWWPLMPKLSVSARDVHIHVQRALAQAQINGMTEISARTIHWCAVQIYTESLCSAASIAV